MQPTLLVLAAGMGSRYGGLKQMDGLGPNGEIIMDYSINDAIRAGFGKVVFVIRHSFEKEFKEKINAEHFGNRIAVEYVFQELDCLPEGFSVPEGREKPWGTNHAILMAKDAIHEPFAIINADDFYGRDAFQVMADHLRTLDGTKGQYCMVGYRLENTLSENGTVSRGVCEVDANGLLAGMTERTSIGRTANGIEYKDTDGSVTTERPPALRFTNDEQVTVSDNPKGNNNFGMYFPWSDGLYKYVASDTGQEKKILVVDGIQGKFWFVESEDAIYFQIDNYNLFESETFILKRDTERNRYPSFYSRDEQINLMAFDSLPEWLRTEAEKKRNFLLNGQTLYGWAPGFPGDYVFFTEDGKGVDIEESGMFYRNNYDIYYNSIEWELIYVFESIR